MAYFSKMEISVALNTHRRMHIRPVAQVPRCSIRVWHLCQKSRRSAPSTPAGSSNRISPRGLIGTDSCCESVRFFVALCPCISQTSLTLWECSSYSCAASASVVPILLGCHGMTGAALYSSHSLKNVRRQLRDRSVFHALSPAVWKYYAVYDEFHLELDEFLLMVYVDVIFFSGVVETVFSCLIGII